MRSSGIRFGEKFVLEDRGGVWEKVAEGRARCVFGSRDDYGREIDIVPDCFVYVIFDRPKPERLRSFVPVQGGEGGGVRVVLRDDEDDSVVMEYENVGPAMVAAIAAADEMAARTGRGKRRFVVMDTAVDIEENAVCVLVRDTEPIEEEYDDRKDRKGLAGRGAGRAPVERTRDRYRDNGDVPYLPEVRGQAGAEGQDMGGVQSSGDSSDRGVSSVSSPVRVEGEAVSGEGNLDGDGERKMEDHEHGTDVVEV